MAAKGTLANTIISWNKRMAELQAQGVPQAAYQEYMQHDIERVKKGGQPRDNLTVHNAIMSAAVQHSVLGDKQRQTGFTNTLGNIGGNTGEVVKGLAGLLQPNRGNPLYKEARDTVKYIAGSEAQQNEVEQQRGIDHSKTGISGLIENLTKLPVIDFIPGSYVAGHAVTSEGRKDLQRNPVTTLLDVLPYVGKAGKLAATSERVAAAEKAAGAVDATKTATRNLGAMKALEEGSPIKALSRKVGLSDEVLRPVAQKLQIGGESKALMENKMVETKRAHHDMTVFDREFQPIAEELGIKHIDEPTVQSLRMVEDVKELPPELQKIHALADTVTKRVADEYPNRYVQVDFNAHLPNEGYKTEIYPAASEAGRDWKKIEQTAAKANEDIPPEVVTAFMQAHGAPRFNEVARQQLLDRLAETSMDTNALQMLRRGTISAATFPKELVERIQNDIMQQMPETMKQYDPANFPRVGTADVNKIMRPGPNVEREYTPGHLRAGVDFKADTNKLQVLLKSAKSQMISEEVTQNFIGESKRLGLFHNKEDVVRDLQKKYPEADEDWIQNTFNKRNVAWDSKKGPNGTPLNSSDLNGLVMPRYLARSLDLMTKSQGHGITKILDTATQAWKYSVLLGPRFLLNQMVSDSMFVLASTNPTVLKFLANGDAYRLAKNGGFEMPYELSGGRSLENAEVYQELGGRGRQLFENSLAARGLKQLKIGTDKFFDFAELVSNTQRAMVYLHELEQGVKKGITDQTAKEARAVDIANKVLVNFDYMTPFESSVVKRVIPFYSFQRHLLKFAFSYPVDHPIRASIVSKIGQKQIEEWSGDLPYDIDTMMFFGKKTKDGHVLGLSGRYLNPFNELGDYFSATGWINSLHPVAKAGLEAMNVDTRSGVAKRFQETTYDPVTGQRIGKRNNFLLKEIGATVPQAQNLFEALQITDELKSKAAANPKQWWKYAAAMANVPLPKDVSLNYERNKAEESRTAQAKQDVSGYLKTGDASQINRLAAVPYGGSNVPTSQLQQIYANAKATLPAGSDTSVKAILPPANTVVKAKAKKGRVKKVSARRLGSARAGAVRAGSRLRTGSVRRSTGGRQIAPKTTTIGGIRAVKLSRKVHL